MRPVGSSRAGVVGVGVVPGSVAVGVGSGDIAAGRDVGVEVGVGRPRQPAKVAHCESSENSATIRAIRLSSPSPGLRLDLDISLLLHWLGGCESILEIGDGIDRLRMRRKPGPFQRPD